MTTEEKAKAYDKALEKVREYYKGLAGCRTKEKLESIFPELKESEDERIRKSIIHFIQVGGYMEPEDKEKASYMIIGQNTVIGYIPESASGSIDLVVPDDVYSIADGAFADITDRITSFTFSANTRLEFIGKEVFKNKADVIVADGFAGNIVLKVTESTASMLLKMIKTEFKSDFVGSIIGLMAKPFLRRILKRINWEVYGGMLLLGVNGISVIAHGRSSAYAMKNAVGAAVRVLNKDINSKISESINR